MPVRKGPDCVGEEMSRFKSGDNHTGKGGKVVTNYKKAKAIALSACGGSKYAEMLQSMGYTEETAKEVAAMFAESFVKTSKRSSSSGMA
jgi:fructoselysine-6-P-deglycase FrlB-like protein